MIQHYKAEGAGKGTTIMQFNLISFCFLLSAISRSQQSNCPSGYGRVQYNATVCPCYEENTIDCGSGKEIIIIDLLLRSPYYTINADCRSQKVCFYSNNCASYINKNSHCKQDQFSEIFKQCNGMQRCSFTHNISASKVTCSSWFYYRGSRTRYFYYLLTVQYGCQNAPSATSSVTKSTSVWTSGTSPKFPSFRPITTLSPPKTTNTTPSVTRSTVLWTSWIFLTTPSPSSGTSLPPGRNTSNAADPFQESSEKSSAGIYVGIGLGCLAILIAVSVISIFLWRRKRQRRHKNTNMEVAFNNSSYGASNASAESSRSEVTIGHNLAQDSGGSHTLSKGEQDYSYATTPNFAAPVGLSTRTNKPVKKPSSSYQEYDDSHIGHFGGDGRVMITEGTKVQQKQKHPINTVDSSEEVYTQPSKKGDGSKAFTNSSDYESQPPVPTKAAGLRTSEDNHDYVNARDTKVPQVSPTNLLDRPENEYQEYDGARDRLYETTDEELATTDIRGEATETPQVDPGYHVYHDDADGKNDDASAPHQEYETSDPAGEYTYADRYRPTRIMQQVQENPPALPSHYGTDNKQESASYTYASVDE